MAKIKTFKRKSKKLWVYGLKLNGTRILKKHSLSEEKADEWIKRNKKLL